MSSGKLILREGLPTFKVKQTVKIEHTWIVQAEDIEITEPILEGMYEGEEGEGLDNRPLKSYIMSIHKQASELYNILDDTEDPEEWVMEKIKSATASMNAVHGHISYAKDKVESLEGTPGEKPQERGY